MLGELMENVSTVVKYFNGRVEAARGKDDGWHCNVQEVLEIIKSALTTLILHTLCFQYFTSAQSMRDRLDSV